MAPPNDAAAEQLRPTTKAIDDEEYEQAVFRLSPYFTEDDLSCALALNAPVLDLHGHSRSDDLLFALMSGTTISSEIQKSNATGEESRVPSSCSTSDPQSTSQTSFTPSRSTSTSCSEIPTINPCTEKKASPFRRRFPRLGMFQKRGPDTSHTTKSPATTDQGVEIGTRANPQSTRQLSDSRRLSTPEKSSASAAVLPKTGLNDEAGSQNDHDAVERTRQCGEMQQLEAEQREERSRFWDYERKCLIGIRLRHEEAKKKKIEVQAAAIEEAISKNDQAVADLESRQLEAEMQLNEELEKETRACEVRLRKMEAYCHGPTPPQSSCSTRSSSYDASSTHPPPPTSLPPPPTSRFSLMPTPSSPTRIVTERDLDNLSHQRRQQATLSTLHRSRVEVLRGRQEKQYTTFIAQKAKEVTKLGGKHKRGIKKLDHAARAEEKELGELFARRREALREQWRAEDRTERARMEARTGLMFALPSGLSFE